ncbi:uncharacterized protein VP01_1839g1, partial [Puccinia sorghi]
RERHCGTKGFWKKAYQPLPLHGVQKTAMVALKALSLHTKETIKDLFSTISKGTNSNKPCKNFLILLFNHTCSCQAINLKKLQSDGMEVEGGCGLIKLSVDGLWLLQCAPCSSHQFEKYNIFEMSNHMIQLNCRCSIWQSGQVIMLLKLARLMQTKPLSYFMTTEEAEMLLDSGSFSSIISRTCLEKLHPSMLPAHKVKLNMANYTMKIFPCSLIIPHQSRSVKIQLSYHS